MNRSYFQENLLWLYTACNLMLRFLNGSEGNAVRILFLYVT
jgi:hypothetical protein